MNSMASKISAMKFQIKWMRQFLDLYGLQQCTIYYTCRNILVINFCEAFVSGNYLSCSLNSSYAVTTYPINCCMQFVTFQIKRMRQFLGLYGLQQCTNYYTCRNILVINFCEAFVSGNYLSCSLNSS